MQQIQVQGQIIEINGNTTGWKYVTQLEQNIRDNTLTNSNARMKTTLSNLIPTAIYRNVSRKAKVEVIKVGSVQYEKDS